MNGPTWQGTWREVILLTGGIKSDKEPGPVWRLLDTLAPENLSATPSERVTQEDAWGFRLAGEILAENLKVDTLSPKRERIKQRILNTLPLLLCTNHLKASERVQTGAHLAKLGDPRPAVHEVDSMEFCYVPAGPFFLGSDATDEIVFDRETGAGEYNIAYDYWLAHFPVTVAQFRQYVNEADVELPDDHSLRGLANAPVVDVSWHDASAFCDWLTQRWQDQGYLPDNIQVCLPSELEWEKAARGGYRLPVGSEKVMTSITSLRQAPTNHMASDDHWQDNPAPQRQYPWGDLADSEHMNYRMHIGEVSSVGAYPQGTSPYGCEEMSGNVWEWNRSLYDDYPYPQDREGRRKRERKCEREEDAPRVVRGGAFIFYHRFARCADRYDRDPGIRIDYVGFRVVLSWTLNL